MWKTRFVIAAFAPVAVVAAIAVFGPTPERDTAGNGGVKVRVLRDSGERDVIVPENIDTVICSGPGCLRLLTYLQAQEMIGAVDSIERRNSPIDARPYALANPWFRTMPVFGEFRGQDNPERIAGLVPKPQVIFKTFGSWGHDPELLEKRTSIPVVLLDYGDLGARRMQLYDGLLIMGETTGRKQRAEELIAFFDSSIEDLARRTRDAGDGPSCYVGGIAMRGTQGFHSTEPSYPPFGFVGANNVAAELADADAEMSHAIVPKEKIVSWDPEIIFLDLSTMQAAAGAGGLHELQNHPAYRNLSAVRNGRVYGVLPYNSYAANFGSILANAYFIGKVLYPDAFADVDPAAKAGEIYRFLLGEAVFEQMNDAFDGLVFRRIPILEREGDESSQ